MFKLCIFFQVAWDLVVSAAILDLEIFKTKNDENVLN